MKRPAGTGRKSSSARPLTGTTTTDESWDTYPCENQLVCLLCNRPVLQFPATVTRAHIFFPAAPRHYLFLSGDIHKDGLNGFYPIHFI